MLTKKLVQTITEYGNTFLVTGSDLLVLTTRDCVDDSIALSYRNLEELSSKQYMHSKNDVFDARTKSIHDPIKKNKLPLFKIQRPKKSVQSKQLAYLRNDVVLFVRLYIANQLREGDPSVFFCHQNQLYPPLSSQGNPCPVKYQTL